MRPRSISALLLAAVALPSCERAPASPPGMRLIPAGEFLMGSRADDAKVYDWEKPHEQPQHPVFVDAFFMDEREVTNAEFERWRPEHPREREHSPCDDCPVTDVTWFDAALYCRDQGKRLPTEAEWEKAAKGGSDRDPEPLDEYAWYAANSIKRAQPVGKKRPNGYGLYDVLGNVREWTTDWFDPGYYATGANHNPKGPGKGARRVERGGAFFLSARGVTTTIRYNHPPGLHLYFLGFRCAKDLDTGRPPVR
jgi:formylglycine-generating enzyme required for sulfatase activity